MDHLCFERSEDAEGIVTFEAMASTAAEAAARVREEALRAMAWARREVPHGPGPLDEGHDWDQQLAEHVEDGRWHVLTLSFAATPAVAGLFDAGLPGVADEAD